MAANLNQIFENEKDKEIIEAANKRFNWKPTFKRFESLRKLLFYGRYVFHTMSIIFGFFFLSLLIDNFIHHIYISSVISFVLLVLFEAIKSLLLEDTFNSIYSDINYFVVGLFAVVLLSISIFSSLNGAKELHRLTDNKISIFKDSRTSEIDSVTTYYDNQVESLKDALKEYEKKVSWKGQINISNKTNQQVISSFHKRINNSLQKKDEAISKLENINTIELSEVKENTAFKSTLIIGLSALNETIILLISWFLVFYDFSIIKEKETIEKFAPKMQVSLDNVAAIMKHYSLLNLSTLGNCIDTPNDTLYNRINTLSKKEKEIGFKIPSERIDTPSDTPVDVPINRIDTSNLKQDTTPRIDTVSDTPSDTQITIVKREITPFDISKIEHQEYLEKHHNVVVELNNGGTIRKTADKLNVSKTTVQTVKKIMKILLSIK